jgi:SAM-dependent methyltransferase
MDGQDRRTAQAASFGPVAATYERGRPSYPARAIDWLLPPGTRRVLDLGAGTGKLTRQLRDRGLEVIAVEPSGGMRDQLIRSVADVPVLAGSAEDIPLDDGSVDVVLVAQAWHWVDPRRAVPEVARVLAGGGELGLLWNDRDDREGWVAQLGRILAGDQDRNMSSSAPVVGPPFGPTERLDVEWRSHLTPETLIDLAASRSYIITMTAGERAAVLAAVRHLLDTHPALAGRAEIVLPYVTRCSRAFLAGQEPVSRGPVSGGLVSGD